MLSGCSCQRIHGPMDSFLASSFTLPSQIPHPYLGQTSSETLVDMEKFIYGRRAPYMTEKYGVPFIMSRLLLKPDAELDTQVFVLVWV